MDSSSVQRFGCPICLASYEYCIPKLLPCIHTVCEQCLRGLIHVGKGKKFKCPQCRVEIKVPKEGLLGFKTNIYLVPDHPKQSKNDSVCAFCAEKSQSFTRLKCGHQLCSACAQTMTSHPVTIDTCPVCQSEAPPPRDTSGLTPSGQWLPQQQLNSPTVWSDQGGQWPTTTTTTTMAQYPTSPGEGPPTYVILQPEDPPVQWPPVRQPMKEPPPLPARPGIYPVLPSAPLYEENEDEGYATVKDIQDPLHGEEWYVGEISRDQSREILGNTRTGGNFLVRKTIKGDPSHVYTLDILYGGTDYHLKIKRRPDDRFYLKNDMDVAKHFDDVQSMIAYYKREKFLIHDGKSGQELKVALKLPGEK